MSKYPEVKNKDLVGTYPASAKSGGGYVWDEVLEYRVGAIRMMELRTFTVAMTIIMFLTITRML